MRYVEQARERAIARRRSHDRAARLLAFNTRWQPLLDTGLKLGGLAWLVMSFLSWLLLNDYLGATGQTGVPLDLAGTWAVLVLFGALLVLALAALGAMFTGGAPIMASLHSGQPAPFATRAGFFAGAVMALVILFVIGGLGGSIPLAIGIALPVGVAAGLLFFHMRQEPFLSEGYAKPAGLLLLWVSTASLLFLVFAINLDSVLRLQLGGATPFAIALAVSAGQMILCFLLPRGWVLGGTVLGVVWLTTFVSPGPRIMVLTALYLTNLGGGMPATALTTPKAAETCNLGTADRPILYAANGSCDKQVALQHLRQLVKAPNLAARGAIIACWRRKVDQPDATCD